MTPFEKFLPIVLCFATFAGIVAYVNSTAVPHHAVYDARAEHFKRNPHKPFDQRSFCEQYNRNNR